ncbi:MAG: hypothetical protein K2M87_07745 [Muribaculaceae bacterium]|nr:hypothetical protein [Muribaculaceae bacterium]
MESEVKTSGGVNEQFAAYAAELPGLDTEAFLRAMNSAPEVSVKLNRRKIKDADTPELPISGEVPWCAGAFYLSERPVFTLNPLLHAGCFYVQDASSMIYQTIVSRLIENHGLTPEAWVADLCAAPGGKTTSMINSLGDRAFVAANEIMPQRAGALRENLLKWGFPNILVTNSAVGDYASSGEIFDVVAVDAPCSGEGMMRKDADAVAQWSPALISSCAALQREILKSALCALRPGGFLIYSTCTFNLEENEKQIAWLAEEYGLEPIDLNLAEEYGIGRELTGEYPALRFMPHLTRGEGLFAAVLRKPGTPAHRNDAKARETLRKRTRVIADGIPQTKTKSRNLEIPTSESVLATDYRRDTYPEAELTLDTALKYLRHESILLPPDTAKGYVCVTYKGYPLGLVKNIGSRANNLYPAAWKIRNL